MKQKGECRESLPLLVALFPLPVLYPVVLLGLLGAVPALEAAGEVAGYAA